MKRADALDWDDLRYFLAVVRAKSLAGAARTMGVEHTTVGRRLTALERALGGALVLRRADGLQLTRLGERLAPKVEELERAVNELRNLAGAQVKRVRLAVPSGFTRYFTTELAQLGRDHPGLALEILSGARPADLSSGEADVAVRIGPVTDQDLVARKLGEAGFSLYASEAYLARRGAPRDLDDFGGHDIVAFHESFSQMPAAQWLEARSSGATIALRSREMVDMLTAAVDGLGLAVLPCGLGDPEPTLRRLTPEVLAPRPLWLVHRAEARLSSEVRVVIDFVVDVLQRHAAAIRGDVHDVA